MTVSRAVASITYPASFMLVSAMNPCPCGYLSDPRHQCTTHDADLEALEDIQSAHISEAIQYRTLDRGQYKKST